MLAHLMVNGRTAITLVSSDAAWQAMLARHVPPLAKCGDQGTRNAKKGSGTDANDANACAN